MQDHLDNEYFKKTSQLCASLTLESMMKKVLLVYKKIYVRHSTMKEHC